MHRWRAVELWQYAAGSSLILLAALAILKVWPFDTAVHPSDDTTVVELVLGDRLTIGLIRTAVLAVVGYVVVSVPALVLERRWMQGLTTTGVTAGPDRSVSAEYISAQLVAMRGALETIGDHVTAVWTAVQSAEGDDPIEEYDD